ncbi:hypothetical protein [Catenulispora acidiphila]|nr:hypothetical protein [Catenulispora acidiphila]
MPEKRQPAGGMGQFRLKRLLKAAMYVDQHMLGVPADAPETVGLTDVVGEIARAIHVDVPPTVLVSPYAEVAISGDTADDMILYVGAPFLLGLPVVELKAVLAYTMAALGEPHPALADAVVRSAQSFQDWLDLFGATTPLGRRYRKFLDASAEVRTDLARHADRAAAALAGSQKYAQNGLARSKAITEHFVRFAPYYLVTGAEPLQDLYRNWLLAAAQPVPAWAVHLRSLVDPPIPGECVPLVAALNDEDVDILVAAIDVDPDDATGYDYDRIREKILAVAGESLGREATPADVVALVADGRGVELAARWDGLTSAELAAILSKTHGMEQYSAESLTSVSTTGELLEAFIPGLAVRHGYRYDPVLRPGVLVADAQPEIEIFESIGSAVVGDTTTLAELVKQLTENR